MFQRTAAALAALCLLALPAGADELDELRAAHPDAIELRELGRSHGGRPIVVAVVARPGTTPADDRPALLVVAGLDGANRLSTRLALASIEALVAGEGDLAELMTRRTVYVVPSADPDGAARGTAGNDRPIDSDRDGDVDEDPPVDLDGDGQATWMRVPDPAGRWRPNADEPRLLVEADRKKGERGVYALHREGLDADGDGEIAEDPVRGVSIDRNFPHRHDAAADEAGRHPASEPETRALLDFVVARANVAAVLVYGLDDTLSKAPAAEAAKPGQPTAKLDPEDLPWFEHAGEIYRELTGVKLAPREVPPGTFLEWAYHHAGRFAVGARGWDPLAAEGEADKRSEDQRKLALAERLGDGFAPWRPFDHPTLGKVEIGGFVDGFEFRAPEEDVVRVASGHAPLTGRLLALLPDVRLDGVECRALGGGLHEVRAAVVNDGYLPLGLAQSRRTRRPGPVVLRLAGEYELVGARPESRHTLIWDVPGSGGRVESVWLVREARGLAVELDSHRGFRDRREIEIR